MNRVLLIRLLLLSISTLVAGCNGPTRSAAASRPTVAAELNVTELCAILVDAELYKSSPETIVRKLSPIGELRMTASPESLQLYGEPRGKWGGWIASQFQQSVSVPSRWELMSLQIFLSAVDEQQTDMAGRIADELTRRLRGNAAKSGSLAEGLIWKLGPHSEVWLQTGMFSHPETNKASPGVLVQAVVPQGEP